MDATPAQRGGAEIGIQVWPEPRSVGASLCGRPDVDKYWEGQTGVNHITARLCVVSEWCPLCRVLGSHQCKGSQSAAHRPHGFPAVGAAFRMSFGLSSVLSFEPKLQKQIGVKHKSRQRCWVVLVLTVFSTTTRLEWGVGDSHFYFRMSLMSQ